MFCIKCGKEIREEAAFCPVCGAAQQEGAAPPTASGPDEWYYMSDDKRRGPFSRSAIKGFIQTGDITGQTPVWREGLLSFVPAAQTELVQELRHTVPPAPLSHKYAWSLASVPIPLSWVLYGVLFGIAAETQNYTFLVNAADWLSLLTIFLNVIFISLDVSSLKKSGFRPSGWMWIGFLFVPVYLFVRAAKTDKKYGYAIVWCVLFAINLLILIAA